MLNQERVTQMATSVTLGDDTSQATNKKVTYILTLANNSYNSLNISNSWNVPSGHHAARGEIKASIKCFNCGENHYLPDCKFPRNEDKIARAKKSAGYSGGPGRKKWSKDGGGGSANHGNGNQGGGNQK